MTIILLLPRLRDMTLLCTRLLPFMSAKTSAPDPIKLFTQPKSFKGITGSSYSLNVAVQGTGGSNQYQWYKDGTALTGETSSTLNFSALAESDAGDYTVVVSNGVSSVTSDTATVTVMPGLQISAQRCFSFTDRGGEWRTLCYGFRLRNIILSVV